MINKYWFKRRRYGYGWVPITKEGWYVVAGYIGLLLLSSFTIINVPSGQFTKEVAFFWLVVILATAGLLRICMTKGPKPKWRWGKKPSDNPFEDW